MKKQLLLGILIGTTLGLNGQNIEESLILRYDLDGNSTNAASSSYHLTPVGTGATANASDRTFNADHAFYFDGTVGLICTDATNLNNQSLSQTISLWFNTTNTTATVYEQVLFGYIESGQSRFILGIKLGTLSLEYGFGSTPVKKFTTNKYNDGKWHHVVCVSKGDNNVGSLYVDGTKQFDYTAGVNNNNRTCDIKVGGDKIQNYYTGYLDDIRVYYKTLTETEISYLQYGHTCITYEKVYNHVSVTDELVINVGIPLSAKNKTENPITIYPNPTNDYIYINTGDYTTITSYKIVISDLNGRIVFQTLVNQQEYPVDLSTFGSKGTYIVEIYDASLSLVDSRKIILK